MRKHGGSLITTEVLVPATVALCVLIVVTLHGEIPGSRQKEQEKPVATHLRVTGRGHAPRRAMSEAQLRLMATRYYPNRDVEVDIELMVPTRGRSEVSQTPPVRAGARGREKPILIEKGGGKISESDWNHIFGMRSLKGS